MPKNSLKIEILGSSFTIQSSDDIDYLKRVIRYLENRILEVQESYSITDPKKILILTSLNLVDKILKLEQTQGEPGKEELREISDITQKLISKLEKSIGEK